MAGDGGRRRRGSSCILQRERLTIGAEVAPVMRPEFAQLFESTRVPRYTSYPTAPNFTAEVGAQDYADWLSSIEEGACLSLYLHVPYCRQLCWYCGCSTQITSNSDRLAAYVELLESELDMVANRLRRGLRLSHLHWGGGTPSVIGGENLARIMTRIGHFFDIPADAERAIELDPRNIEPGLFSTLARAGINRASIGVQTFDPEVQRAINRVQDFDCVQAVVEGLRTEGIHEISMDLLYGLPRQSVENLLQSVADVLRLEPDRIALFGYAHLPSRIKHQKMIDGASLPDTSERVEQYEAVRRRLVEAGYVAIGLDHFARPDDEMAIASSSGRLHRNFQGYTTDTADMLIGIGASAIGSLAQGYVQNHVRLDEYRRAVLDGRLPVARGLELDDQMRADRAIIEAIMCFGEVDIADTAKRFRLPAASCEPVPGRMKDLLDLGIAKRNGDRFAVEEDCRPLLRMVAAAFDRCLDDTGTRHAAAL